MSLWYFDGITIRLFKEVNIGRVLIAIFSLTLFTVVPPIKNANISVIEATVIETPACFNASATLSVGGDLFSISDRLSID